MPEPSNYMKAETRYFFELAREGDPTVKIPNCENLIENLIASAKLLGTNDYRESLQKCIVWSNRAHYLYYREHNIHEALEYCNMIMREVTVIMYEDQKRFALAKTGEFKPRTTDVK